MYPKSIISLHKPASVRKNFIFLVCGNGTSLLSQLCVLWLLHRYCTMEDVGWFFLGLAIASPIILFTGLGLMQVQGTDAAEHFTFGHYLGVRLLTDITAVAAIAIIAASINIGRHAFLVVSLIGLMKAAEQISNVIQGLFYRIEQMKFAAYSRMLHGMVTVIFLGSVIAMTRSVSLGVLAATIGYLGIVIFYDLRISGRYADIRPHFEWKMLWGLGRKAFPLAIVAGLNSLNANLTRYVLVGFLGAAAVGIFGTMAYVIIGLNQFCVAMSHSAMPRLAKYHYQADVRHFTRVLGFLILTGLAAAISVTLGTVLFGHWFLELFKHELAEYSNVFIIVMGGGSLMFLGGILGDVLVSCQRFTLRAIATTIGAVISLVAAIVMVSRWGIAGAAWAALLSNAICIMVLAVMLWWVVAKLRYASGVGGQADASRSSV